jgi:hypothetical protein
VKAGIVFLFCFLTSCASEKAKYVTFEIPVSSFVHEKFQQKRYELTGCYMESDTYSMEKKPGKMIVDFKVNLLGKVEDETVALTDIKDANFQACVLNVVRSLEFGSQNEELKISQAIRFHPETKL